MTLIGYARVSTTGQGLESQLDALQAAGCERIFSEKGSGGRLDLPQRSACYDYLRPGDTLVVYKIDRLGRSSSKLIADLDVLHARGVHFRSLTEGIDTGTDLGRFFYTVMAAFAELDRARIRERTRDGLAAARARGRKGGRKPALTPRQVEMARSLAEQRDDSGAHAYTMTEIAARLGVSRATLYRNTTR
jgi:DNA invertase Pin-like site-specific DNA recombinase